MKIKYTSENFKELAEDLMSVLANTRLILKPDTESTSAEDLKKSLSALLRGILDYHGKNQNWLVS